MKKYNTIIFDLDDTLIDNTKACKYAFKKVLEYLNIPYRDELFYKFLHHDNEYWLNWGKGLMKVPDYLENDLEKKRTYLRATRFLKFFNISSFEEGITLNNIYCDNLGIDIEEIDGAIELLDYLSTKYKIAIATNGPYKAALNKVNSTRIKKYIKDIFCSENIGFSKPKSAFWDYVLARLNEPRDKILLIGDSISTDVASGNINNFDTVWYNPNHETPTDKFKPTYEIILDLKRRL